MVASELQRSIIYTQKYLSQPPSTLIHYSRLPSQDNYPRFLCLLSCKSLSLFNVKVLKIVCACRVKFHIQKTPHLLCLQNYFFRCSDQDPFKLKILVAFFWCVHTFLFYMYKACFCVIHCREKIRNLFLREILHSMLFAHISCSLELAV